MNETFQFALWLGLFSAVHIGIGFLCIHRAKGEGTRNFVVFDDSILKILNRE